MTARSAKAMAGIAAAAVALGVTAAAGRPVQPRGRFPHGGRVGGHQPDPGLAQGVGDPDLRHRRQARPVHSRDRCDRDHRRRRRRAGDSPPARRQRRNRARRDPRLLGRVVASRSHRCRHRADARRHRVRCGGASAAHLGPIHRPRRKHRHRRRAGSRQAPVPGHTRAARRGGADWRGRRGAVAAEVVGGRRPQRVRPAARSRRSAGRPADGAAERRCPTVVCHQQRRLLPDRHGTDGAPAESRPTGN